MAAEPKSGAARDAPGNGRGVLLLRKYSFVVVAAGVLIGLYIVSLQNFNLFHALVELFSIVVACGVFMVAWNSRSFMDNNYILLVGIAYLFVAILDLLHTLAYKGMGVFTGYGTNLATQLWIAARYVESVSLLIAPFFVRRRLRPVAALCAYFAVTGIVVISIFSFDVFPTCFVEGAGLTTFKVASEYLICAVLVAAGFLLWRTRGSFDSRVFRLLMISIALTVASEIAFTLYTDPFGTANMIGHMLKLVSFYLVYRAAIRTGLREPYSLIFRNLKISQERLERANRELSGFAQILSHDIKGPLATVKMEADGLMDAATAGGELPPEEVGEIAGGIGRSAGRVIGLTENILSLAKAGQVPGGVEEVRVCDVAVEVLEDLAPLIEERGARIRVGDELGDVRANRSHVYQIFSNLVKNSIEHNPSPAPVTSVSFLGAGPDGRKRYLVRDNGPGIPEEEMGRVFMPYYSGKEGTTGIGLTTVRRLVEVYGGEIRAYNRDGACFEFSIADYEEGSGE
jgi:signal transduction histidine kinase